MTRRICNILIVIIIILLVFLVLFKVIRIQDELIKVIYKTTYSEHVEKYAKEYNVDKYLIFAVIKAESNFKTDATSNKNAKGVMQLINTTAEEVAQNIGIEYNENILYDVEKNIMLGTKYLSQLLKMYDNNYQIALAAYNAGIGNVEKWITNGTIKADGSDIENIPYKETNNYVRKITRDYEIYKTIYDN